MSCTRILKKVISGAIFGAATGATSGAITGSVGASILDTAGYAGYSVSEATKTAAAGGSVVGAAVRLFKECCVGKETGENVQNASCKEYMGEVAIDTGLSVLGGVLGRAMLNTVVEMPLDKIAAACATGVGAMAGGFVALAVVVVCGACLVKSAVEFQSQDNSELGLMYARL